MKYRLIILFLTLFTASLQYQLWFGEGGLAEVSRLNELARYQRQINSVLAERNQALIAEVSDLKRGVSTIEGLARLELGMIRSGETFFQIVQ